MTKKEFVIEYIKSKIDKGEWRISEKIPSEPILAKDLGVSRMTVREAIEQLSNLKILRKKRGSGTYIKERVPVVSFNDLYPDIELESEGYKDILEVRMALECLALEKVVEEKRENLIKNLKEILGNMEKNIDNESFFDYDMSFHCEISRYSSNKLLWKMIELTTIILKTHSKKYEYNYISNIERVKEHRDILEAMEKNEILAATKSLKNHLENAIDNLKNKE